MFIEPATNATTRAPEERNVCGDEYARSAQFRSSGAGRIFWSFRSINITSLRDEGAARKHCQENKKLTVCSTASLKSRTVEIKITRRARLLRAPDRHERQIVSRRLPPGESEQLAPAKGNDRVNGHMIVFV